MRRRVRLRADADQRGQGPRPAAVLRAAGDPRPACDGQLVVLQSTTYPGTTNGPFREVLERGGLMAGIDFDLAFAPERINPGRPGERRPRPSLGWWAARRPQARIARGTRSSAPSTTQVVILSSPDAAEMAKLLENMFRNVNIALVNQLALLCERMGLDVWEVIDAAATKPFGFMRFTPGPGVGGHCIPVDPYYLSWRAREFDFVDRFVETRGRHQPGHAAARCRPRGRGAQRAPAGAARRPSRRARRGVQAQRE